MERSSARSEFLYIPDYGIVLRLVEGDQYGVDEQAGITDQHSYLHGSEEQPPAEPMGRAEEFNGLTNGSIISAVPIGSWELSERRYMQTPMPGGGAGPAGGVGGAAGPAAGGLGAAEDGRDEAVIQIVKKAGKWLWGAVT